MKNFIFRLVGLLKIGGHMTTTTFLSKEQKVPQHYKKAEL